MSNTLTSFPSDASRRRLSSLRVKNGIGDINRNSKRRVYERAGREEARGGGRDESE